MPMSAPEATNPDRYYLGDTEVPLDSEEATNGLVRRLRQYLELRNVSFLLGNGCSLPAGAPAIGDVRTIRDELDSDPYRLGDRRRHTNALGLLDHLLGDNLAIGVEPLLALLAGFRASLQIITRPQTLDRRRLREDAVEWLESLLKKWLYARCWAVSKDDHASLHYHQELLRRALLRSTTLPRCKIFTTNYDLLIEKALDSLGIVYFDGFIGTLNRTMRTESYHYDLYYPGETTEGRVSRVDRVVHLYKLHGSINWRRTAAPALDVVLSHAQPQDSDYGDVMTYPSPLKLTEMNGYPYSEMFRHFSAQIHQPQSALFVIGYAFADDHINRLIYQALSIPSFCLIIVLPQITKPAPGEQLRPEHEVWRLITKLASKRILVVTGGSSEAGTGFTAGSGTLQDFSTKLMPDIRELDVEAGARGDSARAFEAEPPQE
jgi:hypothetical protein